MTEHDDGHLEPMASLKAMWDSLKRRIWLAAIIDG